MRNTTKSLLIALALCSGLSLQAQKKATYESIKEENGLEYSAKWVDAKPKKSGKKALMVKVTNKTDKALNYSLGVELYVDGVMVESSQVIDFCIAPRRTMQGRLNGIYFIPESVSPDQIGKENFTMELSGEFIGEEPDGCKKRK